MVHDYLVTLELEFTRCEGFTEETLDKQNMLDKCVYKEIHKEKISKNLNSESTHYYVLYAELVSESLGIQQIRVIGTCAQNCFFLLNELIEAGDYVTRN